MRGELPEGWVAAFDDFKKSLAEKQPNEATRKSSENMLGVLAKAIPELVGGSADLTGSNNTKTKDQRPVTHADYSGSYIYYGVREHAMGAVMNGLARYGGFIPYGGTFMVFTDYCRPAIRLSALMQQRVIYVMTHDSIGLGEDGPTHQPVEHMAALRAMPNVLVFRPADAVETAECWQLAIENAHGPSVLALTRQNLPTLRKTHTDENLCAKGAYEISPATGGKAKVNLLATGSEVSLAVEAQKMLQDQGIPTRVVSVPSFELLAKQDAAAREAVLGEGVRIGVEAMVRFGWDQWLGSKGDFVGMKSFGGSAPIKDLYKTFGITADAIVAAAKAKL